MFFNSFGFVASPLASCKGLQHLAAATLLPCWGLFDVEGSPVVSLVLRALQTRPLGRSHYMGTALSLARKSGHAHWLALKHFLKCLVTWSHQGPS